jgi:hypothetical protein
MDLRAVIFLPALVGSAIFVFLLLAFAANHYLTVMQSTGAGARDVEWVSEPFVDNFGKVFYLGWLFGLWAGPAYFIGLAVAPDDGSVRMLVAVAFLWVMYPISQLSSLSASTYWLPLHPDVFVRLAQKPGVVLGFLVWSGLTLAVFGVALRWSFGTKGQSELLFVGAPLLVASGLVYARLVGRLAFALTYTKSLFGNKKEKKPKPDDPPPAPHPEPRPAPKRMLDAAVEPDVELIDEVEESPEPPPIQTPEGEVSGYGVFFDDDPPPKPKKRVVAEVNDDPPPPRKKDRKRPASEPSRAWTEDDEDANPYGVKEAVPTPEPAKATTVIKPSPVEMRLMAKDDSPKPPKETWHPQLLQFLVQPTTLPVVGLLVVLCLLAGFFVRLARDFDPTT